MVTFGNEITADRGPQPVLGMSGAAAINSTSVAPNPPAQYSYNPILPPAFNYTPSQQWLSQLQKYRQQQPQFQGLLSGWQQFNMPQQKQATVYSGFNAPAPNSMALASQYLSKG